MRIRIPFKCPDCKGDTVYDYEGIGGEWYCPNCNALHYTGYDDEGDSVEVGLSLEDAALIYGSNGCDEDYTYGYSEDELEDYLK